MGMEHDAAVEETIARGERVLALYREMNQPSGSFSSSGIHFHGSAGLSILSILAICVCVMSLGIGAAWYNASMRELNTLRDRLDLTDAYVTAHEKRINKLENPPQ